jgi:hypothetical protein
MAIAFVQSASTSNDATLGTIARAFPSNVGSGRLIVVHVAHGGTTDQVTGIVDTVGSTYTEIRFLAGVNVSGSLWYASPTPAAGASMVTATLATSSVFRRMAIHEISGQAATPLDTSAAARFALGACGDSGNMSTAVNGEYIFGAMHTDQGGDFTIAAGTNEAWTLRENYQHANAPAATEDFVQTTAGTTKAAFTEGSCTLWRIYYGAAFKPAGGLATDDVVVRYGSMGVTDGSGLVTSAFADASAGATVAGGGLYPFYYRTMVADD